MDNTKKDIKRCILSKFKSKGFVIYPGKVTQSDSFRIGNIGEVYPQDMHRLIGAVESAMYWQ